MSDDDVLRDIMGKEPWVPDRLARLGDLYRKRRLMYGGTDKNFGKVMKGLFPNPITIETEEDWSRLGLFLHIVNKQMRYAAAFSRGGHVDSLDDTSVYSQMLQQYDDECRPEPYDPAPFGNQHEIPTPEQLEAMNGRYVLVDVDHTLSDARWRDGMILAVNSGEKTWDEYHAEGCKDPPFAHAIRLVNALAKDGYMIIGLTSRPEKWREDTWEWFDLHGMHADGLLMRPDDDHQASPALKYGLAVDRFGPNLNGVIMLIDDREDVCQRFRPHGVLCLQVHVDKKNAPDPSSYESKKWYNCPKCGAVGASKTCPGCEEDIDAQDTT